MDEPAATDRPPPAHSTSSGFDRQSCAREPGDGKGLLRLIGRHRGEAIVGRPPFVIDRIAGAGLGVCVTGTEMAETNRN